MLKNFISFLILVIFIQENFGGSMGYGQEINNQPFGYTPDGLGGEGYGREGNNGGYEDRFRGGGFGRGTGEGERSGFNGGFGNGGQLGDGGFLGGRQQEENDENEGGRLGIEEFQGGERFKRGFLGGRRSEGIEGELNGGPNGGGLNAGGESLEGQGRGFPRAFQRGEGQRGEIPSGGRPQRSAGFGHYGHHQHHGHHGHHTKSSTPTTTTTN
ncbi:hypothetical protein ACQ4LE_006080 [Meloidogyne hapla]|uniref:Uncharacterized protein n=1 Tax=Meloidogyne hapla TaxID=6305 RepID=A0A1I8BWB4_MELHA